MLLYLAYIGLIRQYPESIFSLLVVFALSGFFIFLSLSQNNATLKWFYPNSFIIEAIIIILLYTINIWLFYRESKYTDAEVLSRAKDIVNRLESSGLNMMQVS